jgi:aminopeptidase YwaD
MAKAKGIINTVLPLILIILMFACRGYRKVTVEELENHIKYLSSDSLKGRLAGSSGDSLAAFYIRDALAAYGFKNLNGDGIQRFRVTSKLMAGPENSLSANEAIFAPQKDFMPFAFSSNSGLIAEAVFAGYGFNINGDSLKWNDYKGIDVKDKWVLVLRADPESDKSVSPFIPYSGDRDKVMVAKDMGAAGVLLISGAAFDSQDTFESLSSNDFSTDIPVFRVKRDAADLILSKTGKKVADLEKRLNESRKPFSFATKTIVCGKAEIIRETSTARNVAMILPGEDKNLKNEYIIIGAHFDHLGMGGPGSSSRAVDTIAVHHGADDNASGVSMMLELAEKIAHSRRSHARSIICLSFSGEEEGLLGSKYFADNPVIDLSKVNAMINLDMVGRLQETKVLHISGVGTAKEFRDMVSSGNDTNNIRLTLSDEGYGSSDHTSFYGKDIPVLFYTTGAHLDYHTPSDTYDKINYKGMLLISVPIYKVIEKLANTPEKLKFIEAGPKVEQGRQLRKKSVTLGIMPDFAGIVKNGLRADEVDPGRPAALGGMKKGDIITSINGKNINNIYDYMSRMGRLKHGQSIIVEVLRDGTKINLLIQL